VYGFINTVKKILKENDPDYMAVCFDSAQKTHRQEKFAAYKIQRPAMPEELRSQIPIIKEIVSAYNLQFFESPGYEADDIIATLAKWPFHEDVEVVIVSDDKDLYQLVNERVSVLSMRQNKILTTEDIVKRLGFSPLSMTDYIGLVGDKTDNIPGVNGIGDVTAKKLISEFGTLENIIQQHQQIKSSSIRRKIVAHQKDAILSKELAHLEDQVPLKFQMDTLRVQDPNAESLLEIFQRLGFHRWSQELMTQHSEESTQDIQDVNTRQDWNALLEGIHSKGEFAFLHPDSDDQKTAVNTDHQRYFYVSLGGEIVYRFKEDDILSLKGVLVDQAILKITYSVKNFLKTVSRMEGMGDIVSSLSDVKDPKNFFDVKLAGYLLSSGDASFKLNDLAWTYLKIAFADTTSLAYQTVAVYQLYLLMFNELDAQEIVELFSQIEMPLTFVLFRMEQQGVHLDKAFLKDLSRECDEKIDALRVQLYNKAGEEFNINSPKQLSRILFEKLQLPVIKKIKTGYSTNEEVLKKLALEHEFPLLILEYRQLAKLKSTYIDALPRLVNPQTQRIHTQFLQTGTDTGRLSSRNPNLQNIPIRNDYGRSIRKAFIPFDRQSVLLKADYSQIELRILAHLSEDEGLRKAFHEGQDIHTYTASLMFEKPTGQVTESMRTAAKRVNFGIIYGMSAYGLAKDLRIPQEEASDFIDRYFMRYKQVKTFMDDMVKLCEKQGYSATILGRRRNIPNIKHTNGVLRQFAQRQAINTPVQGSAADLIKLAMVNVEKNIEQRNFQSQMIITVHDELVFNVKKTELSDMVRMVKDTMENAISLSVPIEVSLKSGPNWLDMQEI
jgi:DNA polymerase-1